MDTSDKIQPWEMGNRNKTKEGLRKLKTHSYLPFKHFQILPRLYPQWKPEFSQWASQFFCFVFAVDIFSSSIFHVFLACLTKVRNICCINGLRIHSILREKFNFLKAPTVRSQENVIERWHKKAKLPWRYNSDHCRTTRHNSPRLIVILLRSDFWGIYWIEAIGVDNKVL